MLKVNIEEIKKKKDRKNLFEAVIAYINTDFEAEGRAHAQRVLASMPKPDYDGLRARIAEVLK